MATFVLSAFGDEIVDELERQLEVLAAEGLRQLEFRAAWGVNVLDLNDARLSRAADLLQQHGFGVSAIGSPIGKSALDQPREFELERLERAIAAAQALGTRQIRIFSFYVQPGETQRARPEVLARLAALAERAGEAGVTLLHENEKEIYGDIPERCLDLLTVLDAPALRQAFDPANFVQVGVRPMDQAWPLLADYTTHVHIKDAVFADGSVRAAGAGDGQIPELLAALAARNYQGFLTLEPHLKIAGPAGGVSGEDGMRVAIRALRQLIAGLTQPVELR